MKVSADMAHVAAIDTEVCESQSKVRIPKKYQENDQRGGDFKQQKLPDCYAEDWSGNSRGIRKERYRHKKHRHIETYPNELDPAESQDTGANRAVEPSVWSLFGETEDHTTANYIFLRDSCFGVL